MEPAYTQPIHPQTLAEEIEGLYSDAMDMQCDCTLHVESINPCEFRRKMSRISYLQDREIDLLSRELNQIGTVLSETTPLLEEMDVDFADVLK